MSVKIIRSCTQPVKIIRTTEIIKVVSPKPSPLSMQDFSFTATNGQTVFTLPSTPVTDGLFIAIINGSPQDREGGDYTVSGTTLTFDEALDTNDKVYGSYEKA